MAGILEAINKRLNPQNYATQTMYGSSITGGQPKTVNALVTGSSPAVQQQLQQQQYQKALQTAGPGYKVVQTKFGPALASQSFQPTEDWGGGAGSAEEQWAKYHPGEGVKPVGYGGESGGPSAPEPLGSFGGLEKPDLSNPAKVAEYNRYLQSQGLPSLQGDPNKIAAEFNRTGTYDVPSVLGASTQATASTGGGLTGSLGSQPAIFEAMQRGLSNWSQSPTAKTIGGLIQPLGSVQASGGQTQEYAPTNFTLNPVDLLGRLVAGGGALASKLLGREVRLGGDIGLGARIAGQNAPFQTSLSTPASLTSQYFPGTSSQFQPVERTIGRAATTPEIPTLVGQMINEPTTAITPPAGGGGGGGAALPYQNPEIINDLLMEAIEEHKSGGGAMMETPDFDADFMRMRSELGLPEKEAAMAALDKQIMSVTDLLDNLDADITEIGKNSLMTEAQRRRLIAARGNPLRKQLVQLMRGAEKYGIGYKEALNILNTRIQMSAQTYTAKIQAQQAQEANRQRSFQNILSLLPYTTLTAAQRTKKSTGGGGGTKTTPSIAQLLAG